MTIAAKHQQKQLQNSHFGRFKKRERERNQQQNLRSTRVMCDRANVCLNIRTFKCAYEFSELSNC